MVGLELLRSADQSSYKEFALKLEKKKSAVALTQLSLTLYYSRRIF